MKRLFTYPALILILGSIATTNSLFLIREQITGEFYEVEVILLTLIYFAATIHNLQVLIPRMLLRNRLTAYLFSLAGWIILFISIEIGFEWLLLNDGILKREDCWYIGNGPVLSVLRVLSSIAAYSIAVLGTAVIFFMRLWKQSNKQIQNLEEQNARSEVEKIRTRIDSEALFETLDKAAEQVERAPAEVFSMLMTLSRSLREQLYKSHHKPSFVAQQQQPESTVDLYSPALNLLTKRRHNLFWHILLITWFILITTGDLEEINQSLLELLPPGTYLALVYFNIYVLVPKFMKQGRVEAYLAGMTLLVVFIGFMIISLYFWLSDLIDNITYWNVIVLSVGNIFKLILPVFGASVLVLFRYWVINERRIAELQTATLLAELEQLQNQVNPHFLFNMLNNITVLTRTNPGQAADVLHKLNDMLKYQFHGFIKQSIQLGDDIRFLNDYLNLEKLRRDHFEFSITTDGDVEDLLLPPLLFIPFVENAVKHNNDNRTLSFIRLRFVRENDDKLYFVCINSKPIRPMRKDEAGGLGLPNVQRRLNLLYGNRYHMEITENDLVYAVQLSIEFNNKKL